MARFGLFAANRLPPLAEYEGESITLDKEFVKVWGATNPSTLSTEMLAAIRLDKGQYVKKFRTERAPEMRVFIHKITYRWNEGRPPLYDFTASAKSSWRWETRAQAEQARRIFEQVGGIVIEQPFVERLFCEDYRVEPRPQGGFGISCIHPVAVSWPLSGAGELPKELFNVKRKDVFPLR
jgi:hypothetical protein